jgi:AcrR family transcriptional regulator
MRRSSGKSTDLKPSRPRGRPPTIDSEQLLAVARSVFLERGIRATTAEVAERAGVSEGVLFHRFKSKEELFGAAMDFDREEAPGRVLRAIEELDGLEPREAIMQLATTLIEVGRVAIPILMMSWSNPQPCVAPPFDKKRHKFSLILKTLASYFERQMERGKLRQMDAEVLARALLGSVHHFVMTRLLMEGDDGSVMPEGMFVRGLTDLVLNGAALPEAPPRNPRVAALSVTTGTQKSQRKA